MATNTYNGGNVTHTSPANVTWNSRLTVTTTEYPTYVAVSCTGIFYVHGSAAPYLVANRMTATLTIAGSNVKTYTGPSSQTTYKGATTVLSYSATYQKTTTAQNKACSFKITVGSASSWSGTSTATVTGGISIPALASYTVDYNANGGSGSISSQTKYYSITLPLSDGTGFTRTNHTQTGWNTEDDASGTQYELGGSFNENNDATLYATWHLDYLEPVLSNTSIYRVSSSSSTTETDDGEYIYIAFNYVGGSLTGGETRITPTIDIEIDGDTPTETIVQPVSATGTYAGWFYGQSGYSKEEVHDVIVTVHDTNSEGVSFSEQIATATYPIDLIGDGNDVYMGVMSKAISGQPLTFGERGIGPDMSAQELSDFIDSLNPSAANVADYVEEYGSLSERDYYRKWHSGKAEFWYRIYMSSGLTTAALSSPIYYGDSTAFVSIWQGVFTVAPSQVLVASNFSQIISMIPMSWDVNGITNLRYVTVGAKSNSAYGFSVYAVGRWK